MAKKKTAKKPLPKKSAKKAKKTTAKKKVAKSAARKSVKKAARAKRPAGSAAKAKSAKKPRAARKPAARRPRTAAAKLAPNQYVEKMSVSIEVPNKSGDLVVTESLGGAALVHHTVHPGAETTAIPGQSYGDLKKLGAGTHEIEVVRSLPPVPAERSS
jgi:hypothetical protein